MLIHNCTFMLQPARREEFLKWFLPLAPKASGEERNMRVSILRKIGSEEELASQPASIAYQLEFETYSEIDLWVEKRLNPIRKAFQRNFGPEAMVFTSIFETIL